MKKIAILNCLKSAGNSCTGAACLQAFYRRTGAFEQYAGEELELTAFFQCNGCGANAEDSPGLQKKINRILEIHPDAVHVGVCTSTRDGTRCNEIQEMIGVFLENGIPVLDGTHSSALLTHPGAPVSYNMQ